MEEKDVAKDDKKRKYKFIKSMCKNTHIHTYTPKNTSTYITE